MATVKELRELLATMPDEYEVVIYPKYSANKVDGFREHHFRIDQVCLQEPCPSPIVKYTRKYIKENSYIAIIL